MRFLGRLLFSWLVLAVAIALTAGLLPGIEIHGGFFALLRVAVVFALVNTFLGPILRLLSAPIIILTLGLFALVVNALLFLLTDWLTDSLSVDGFLTALLGALLISVVDGLLEVVLERRYRDPARA